MTRPSHSSREPRVAVSHGHGELGLRHEQAPAEVRSDEACSWESGAEEIRHGQIGPGQIGAEQ